MLQLCNCSLRWENIPSNGTCDMPLSRSNVCLFFKNLDTSIIHSVTSPLVAGIFHLLQISRKWCIIPSTGEIKH